MKTITYPVGLPEDLYGEVKETADRTKLSMADAIRQGLRLGLPVLRERLSVRKKRLPKNLSAWDALVSGAGLNVTFPRLKGKVQKIEL